jgi:hypothetical protein
MTTMAAESMDKVKYIEDILADPEGIDLWKLREVCLSEGGLVHGALLADWLSSLSPVGTVSW